MRTVRRLLLSKKNFRNQITQRGVRVFPVSYGFEQKTGRAQGNENQNWNLLIDSRDWSYLKKHLVKQKYVKHTFIFPAVNQYKIFRLFCGQIRFFLPMCGSAVLSAATLSAEGNGYRQFKYWFLFHYVWRVHDKICRQKRKKMFN